MMIIRRSFFLSLVLLVLPACFADKQITVVPAISIVGSRGNVCPEMLQMLSLTGITHDGSLQDIVRETQKSWLRKPGTERWEVPSINMAQESEMRLLVDRMGFTQEVKPQQKSYTYLLLLGALFSTVAARMEYAVNLWKSGVRFEKIVLLGGARPMTPEQGENLEKFLEWSGKSHLDYEPKTETDVLRFVVENIAMPDEMRALPMTVIDVPMLQKPDGSMRRPTTGDTIEWWLKTNPEQGTCLAVSNQPYVIYQASVLKTLLPAQFPVATVGDKAKEDKELGILLDTLARVLYQEQQYLLARGSV